MSELTTILLVEDNEDDAELMEHAFGKAGIINPLIVVTDGDAAVDYLEGKGVHSDRAQYPLPSLVLLDLKLPRRSGFEVLKFIRSHAGTKHTPVIVITSSNQNKDIKQCYELGANSYLVKPVRRDALVEMVRSLKAFWIKLNQVPAP